MVNYVHFTRVNITDKCYDIQIKAHSIGGITVNELDVNINEVDSRFFRKIFFF